uniref:HDC11603 n=1 Tax=Drosophila melanogaster TaxID=7227 RepID=Q6IKS1_DROME|nr:TPA_inf: HDC11603 [Drosophila melanogaster]
MRGVFLKTDRVSLVSCHDADVMQTLRVKGYTIFVEKINSRFDLALSVCLYERRDERSGRETRCTNGNWQAPSETETKTGCGHAYRFGYMVGPHSEPGFSACEGLWSVYLRFPLFLDCSFRFYHERTQRLKGPFATERNGGRKLHSSLTAAVGNQIRVLRRNRAKVIAVVFQWNPTDRSILTKVEKQEE